MLPHDLFIGGSTSFQNLKFMNRSRNTLSNALSVLQILMITAILIGGGNIHAQSQNEPGLDNTEMAPSKHEVSGHLKGPFSGLHYKFDRDKQKLHNGFGFGINYSYYLNTQWSLTTGAEVQSFKGEVSYNAVTDAYNTVDAEGEAFEFRYKVMDASEKQSATYLNVPFKVQYESTGQTRFYAAGGVKIGLLLKSEYESVISSLTTSGYYSQYDAELSEPEFMGFGTFSDLESGKDDLNLSTNFSLEMEAGLKFAMAKKQVLYLGLFLDYGLKDLNAKKGQQNLIFYNSDNPTAFITESILNATNKTRGNAYVDKLNTIAFGLKIRYGLSL